MQQKLEFISTHNPFTPTMLGIPKPFPRGYGNRLYLFSKDGSTRYYVANLSYEDILDALKLNLIDDTLQVISTVVEPPSVIWSYEQKFEIYKSVIVVDSRLPKECLGDYEEDFLKFLSNDIEEHPENVHAVPTELWEKVKELVKGVDVNLDEPLEDDE